MNIFQGQAIDIFISLKDTGVPVPGLLYSDIILRWWRPGDVAVNLRAVTVLEWVDLTNGDYILKLNDVDTSILGILKLRLNGASFDQADLELMVSPSPIGFLATSATCIVMGNTKDLTGRLLVGKEVIFRPVDGPNAHGGSIVGFDRILTYTDALGNFSVNLLRETKAIVEIRDAALLQQFEVPDQGTAQLLDLLPPIP